MAETGQPSALRWWALERGDIDATVAQVGFNVAQMIIPAFLLVPVGIAMGFSVGHLLPGFALGFFVGSMGLTALAVGLAKREGRTNVTAHVYINNVPGIIAYTLSIMLPVYLQTRDQELAWRVGAAAVVWTGIIKLVAAPLAGTIRKYIPKPAMMTVFGAAMYTYLAMVLLQRIFDQAARGNRRADHRRGLRPGQCSDHEVEDSSLPRRVARSSRHWIVHWLHSSRLARFFRAASLRANSGPAAGDGPRDSLSFRDRADGDLPGAAGHRIGGRSELSRR